LLEIY